MSSLHRIINCQIAIVCIVALLIGACGHEPVRRVANEQISVDDREPARPQKTARRTIGEQAAVVALRQIGVPYVYGGSSEQGFDCSGLVQFAYANVGARIPRTTSEQWRKMTPVAEQNMRVGDLLFFRISGKISHVGLYLGDRRFVHAPSTGRQVSVEVLDSDFYRQAFVRAARP